MWMHRSGADACWSRASMKEFIAMQQNMAGIQFEPKEGDQEIAD
jgi:hypothetical protein